MGETKFKQQSLATRLLMGWNSLPVFTRLTDLTFTIPGDWTGILRKSDKLEWTQNGSAKYAYLGADPTYSGGVTTCTILSGSGVVVTNGQACSGCYFSKMENPTGFPPYFIITGIGYFRMGAAGFLHQWGQASITVASGTDINTGTVTLPIAYANTGYSILLGNSDGNNYATVNETPINTYRNKVVGSFGITSVTRAGTWGANRTSLFNWSTVGLY